MQFFQRDLISVPLLGVVTLSEVEGFG